MFKINRKIEYALMALKHIEAKAVDALSSAKEISAAHGTPFDATSRVLQVLAQHGVLVSEQGAHGGYRLSKDLSGVRFLELAEMLLGPVNVVSCLYEGNEACDLTNTCNIISPISRLNERLKQFYNNLTVQELIENPGRPLSGQTSGFESVQKYQV